MEPALFASCPCRTALTQKEFILVELKTYIFILLRKWWIIVPTFAVTLFITFVLTNRQPSIYETSTTLVMRPRSSFVADEREMVRIVDILSQRIEINTTYAEVAKSRLIKNRAIERLGLSAAERKNLTVRSKVIPGTNILELSVEGSMPEVLPAFAAAVRAETIDYIGGLYDVFELEPLDEAATPKKPIRPNRTLNLAVGAVLGLLLGMMWAFLIEYLLMPAAKSPSFDIVDSETGVCNKAFFLARLQQETSRAKRNGYPLSLALIKIGHSKSVDSKSHQIAPEALRTVGALLTDTVREEDVVARIDETTFALLLPDMTDRAAQNCLEEIQKLIAIVPLDRLGAKTKLYLRGAIGVTTYDDHTMEPDAFLAHGLRALEKADRTAYGTISLYAPDLTAARTPRRQEQTGQDLHGLGDQASI